LATELNVYSSSAKFSNSVRQLVRNCAPMTQLLTKIHCLGLFCSGSEKTKNKNKKKTGNENKKQPNERETKNKQNANKIVVKCNNGHPLKYDVNEEVGFLVRVQLMFHV
jgi:hypothetical protein